MMWVKYETPEGDEYYYNDETDETTWEEPQDAEVVNYSDVSEIEKLLESIIDQITVSHAQSFNSFEESDGKDISHQLLSTDNEQEKNNVLEALKSVEPEDSTDLSPKSNCTEPNDRWSTCQDDIVDSKATSIPGPIIESKSEMVTHRPGSYSPVQTHPKNPFDEEISDVQTISAPRNPFDDDDTLINLPRPIQPVKKTSFIIRNSQSVVSNVATDAKPLRYVSSQSTEEKQPTLAAATPYPKNLFASTAPNSTMKPVTPNYQTLAHRRASVPAVPNPPQTMQKPHRTSMLSFPSIDCAPSKSAAASPLHQPPAAVLERKDLINPNVIILNLMGTNIKVAAKALEKANNDLEKAADAIHDEMVTAVNKNPFNSHLNLWVPRLSLRIKSWLPNILDGNDLITGFVVTVNFTGNESTKSWKVTRRFNKFKELNSKIQRFGPHVPINAAFPFDSVAMTLFGLSDADRNARMDALDKWLREVTLNPCLMTLLKVSQAVYEFLEVDTNIADMRKMI